jgi:hypothetical protein
MKLLAVSLQGAEAAAATAALLSKRTGATEAR